MIFVARNSKQGKRISIKGIAKGSGAAQHFVAKIMQAPGRKKIVQSGKGSNGGFYLDKEDFNLSLADIVTPLDGNPSIRNVSSN